MYLSSRKSLKVNFILNFFVSFPFVLRFCFQFIIRVTIQFDFVIKEALCMLSSLMVGEGEIVIGKRAVSSNWKRGQVVGFAHFNPGYIQIIIYIYMFVLYIELKSSCRQQMLIKFIPHLTKYDSMHIYTHVPHHIHISYCIVSYRYNIYSLRLFQMSCGCAICS